MTPPNAPHDAGAAGEEASRWVMRLDRGLTPAEQDAYLQWLAADPRRGQAMATLGRTWDSFDRLAGFQSSVEAPPDPDLLQPRANRRAHHVRWGWWVIGPLAVAAALAMLASWQRGVPREVRESVGTSLVAIAPPAQIEERTLEDGSIVQLNRGAVLAVDYSATMRRIRLERGEASFKVTKDPARPFVVVTAGIAVQAVGTEFNVHLGADAVDVIVTEGTVTLLDDAAPGAGAPPTITAGQRAVVPLAKAERPVVTTPLPEELSRRLAWQPRLLTFNDEPLPVILGEFNRHNPVMLRLEDASLQELRLSMRFRSDNVQGFLRLLESEFRVRAQAQSNGEIVLRARR
jgi:transmembrane sensor